MDISQGTSAKKARNEKFEFGKQAVNERPLIKAGIYLVEKYFNRTMLLFGLIIHFLSYIIKKSLLYLSISRLAVK